MTYSLQKTPATLIATLGTEPQVVTAALDLLRREGERISRVVVVHTVTHGTTIEESVATLQRDFDNPRGDYVTPLNLVPIIDLEDRPLPDVDTLSATQAAFRVIYNQVRVAKKQASNHAGSRVHLCIAGGRKTMAVFGMVTAQLLFDDDDRLWHLYSGGDFLKSKRMHPEPGDDVHLIPIPVVQWSTVSPMLLDLGEIEDPFDALELQKELHLVELMEESRAFVRGSLTPAEERVVALLVREGLSDNEIAERLVLSPRTIEKHLGVAYDKAVNHWDLDEINRTVLTALLNLYYTLTHRETGTDDR